MKRIIKEIIYSIKKMLNYQMVFNYLIAIIILFIIFFVFNDLTIMENKGRSEEYLLFLQRCSKLFQNKEYLKIYSYSKPKFLQDCIQSCKNPENEKICKLNMFGFYWENTKHIQINLKNDLMLSLMSYWWNDLMVNHLGMAEIYKEYYFLYKNDPIEIQQLKKNLIKYIWKNWNIPYDQKEPIIKAWLFLQDTNHANFDEFTQKKWIERFNSLLKIMYPDNYAIQNRWWMAISCVYSTFLHSSTSIKDWEYIGLTLENFLKSDIITLKMLSNQYEIMPRYLSDIILLKNFFSQDPNIKINNLKEWLDFYIMIDKNINFFLNQGIKLCVMTDQDPEIVFRSKSPGLTAKFYIHAYSYFYKGFTFKEYCILLQYLIKKAEDTDKFYEICLELNTSSTKEAVARKLKKFLTKLIKKG